MMQANLLISATESREQRAIATTFTAVGLPPPNVAADAASPTIAQQTAKKHIGNWRMEGTDTSVRVESWSNP